MINRRHFTFALAALPFTAAKTGVAQAQSYPAKSIRFVVPFPAGGSTDVGARLIAENLSRAFGQQVYVENKSGANGTIGIEDVAKSAPDGYTILVSTELGRKQSTRISQQCRSFQGPVTDHTAFTSAHRAGGPPFAGRQHARRIDCAGKEAAKLAIRDRKRSGVGAAYGGTMVRADRRHYARAGALSRRRPGDQRFARRSRQAWIARIDAVDAAYKAGTLRLLAQTSKTRSPSLPDVPTYEEAGDDGAGSRSMARRLRAGQNPAGYCEPSQQRDQQGDCRSGGTQELARFGARAGRWNKPINSPALVREDYARYRAAGEGSEHQG